MLIRGNVCSFLFCHLSVRNNFKFFRRCCPRVVTFYRGFLITKKKIWGKRIFLGHHLAHLGFFVSVFFLPPPEQFQHLTKNKMGFQVCKPSHSPHHTKGVPAYNTISKSAHQKVGSYLQLHIQKKIILNHGWSVNKVTKEENVRRRFFPCSEILFQSQLITV